MLCYPFLGFMWRKESCRTEEDGIKKASELRKKENTRQPQPGTRISKDKC